MMIVCWAMLIMSASTFDAFNSGENHSILNSSNFQKSLSMAKAVLSMMNKEIENLFYSDKRGTHISISTPKILFPYIYQKNK